METNTGDGRKMSIKELLKLPVEDLAKLSDAQKKEYFAPYLKMIRPITEQEKNGGQGVRRVRHAVADEQAKTLDMVNKLAKKFGIKPEDI